MPDKLLLSADAMGKLMPMHLWLNPAGMILRAGPTLQKLRPDQALAGRRFWDVFNIRRPRDMDVIHLADGQRLTVAFCRPPQTTLKGLLLRLPGDQGMLLNLSFGVSVVEAVAEYNLTLADFAATDLAIEMLYLVEAKSAVMEETRRLNERLQAAHRAAEAQSLTDSLTGLHNRRALQRILARMAGERRRFALMHVDLDFFKSVNDTLGHAAGDAVLQQAARVLCEETRQGDAVIRAGGDEFVIVFEGLADPTRLLEIADRIIRRLEEPVMFEGTPCCVSGSIGIAVSGRYDPPNAPQMLHDADQALYASKRAGRGRATVFQAEGKDDDDQVGC